MAGKWLCASWNIWQSGIFYYFYGIYFNILKSKVLVHWIEPTAQFRRHVPDWLTCVRLLPLILLVSCIMYLWLKNRLVYVWLVHSWIFLTCVFLCKQSQNKNSALGMIFLNKKITKNEMKKMHWPSCFFKSINQFLR